jgi:ADP-dependent NAD(P)H-hydrate dehydratase
MSEPAEHVLTPATLRDWPLPQPQGDKHSRGTIVVVGGAAATIGAVMLAGVAALRAGAGVLQLRCDPSTAAVHALQVP